MTRELEDPHHVTVGWVGVPGDRTFYLQVDDGEGLLSVRCEKGQVAALGDVLRRLLVSIEDAPATDWDRAAMDLRDPIEPRWVAGDVQVGYDPEQDRFLLEVNEWLSDEELVARWQSQPDEGPGDTVRVWLNRDQARRLAAHALEVVGQGRPACPLCGRPREPEGHVCPATNGHGRLSR